MTYTVRFGDGGAADPAYVGGKAASLSELTRAGMPVPPGFAITVDAFRVADATAALARKLDALVDGLEVTDLSVVDAISAAARHRMATVRLPDDVRAAILAAYIALGTACGDPDLPVAVRSSAVGEDGESVFAGEYETVLWVRGASALLDAVRQCWASLYTTRAIVYRIERQHLSRQAPLMAVAVQQMARPRVAGVAFTLDPSNGDRSQVAIDAAWGFGGSVASGEVTPDSYLVDKVLHQISHRRIGVKSVQHRLDADGRVTQGSVAQSQRELACLDDDEVLAIARLASEVERHLGRPQDIEWAIEQDQPVSAGLRLLQSRPETVWSRQAVTAQQPLHSVADPATEVAAALTAGATVAHLDAPAGRPRSPFDDDDPAGSLGWRSWYPSTLLFDESQRGADEVAFWFQDAVHWPEVVTPWEATILEFTIISLAETTNRRHVLPASRGVRSRVHRGYVYLSPVVVSDAAEVADRLPHFLERGGHHYAHWDELYAAWTVKVTALVRELEALDFRALPDREDLGTVTDGDGTGSGFALTSGYRRLVDLAQRLGQLHFELLDLGYAAYLDFFGFCRRVFPGIPDLAVARMVSSGDSDLTRPDRELRQLARLAMDLGVDAAFDGSPTAASVDDQLGSTPEGRRWLAAWVVAAQPWFAMSSGSGFSHRDRSWVKARETPYRLLHGYIAALRDGQDVTPPAEGLQAENDRVAREYAALIADSRNRETFQQKLGLARKVFPHVENHNFSIEHRGHSAIWEAMRTLGSILEGQGFLSEEDDVFLLTRYEVEAALFDVYGSWATGSQPRDAERWHAEVQRRGAALDVLRAWSPPPALGTATAEVSDPLMVMLWGVTPQRSADWLAESTAGSGILTGLAASPGIGEGPARVVHSPEQLSDVREGEVLVAPVTSPGWAPVFNRVSAVVTDVGGVMSHAAIVCREYGLPAVTGTVDATRRIVTGQRLRVDGTRGTVTLLDEPTDQGDHP